MKDKLFKHNKSRISFTWKKILIVFCVVFLFVALVAVPVSICISVQSNIHTVLFEPLLNLLKI